MAIRIIKKNNEDIYCVKDICDILELSNISSTTNKVSQKNMFKCKVETTSGIQICNFVNIIGLKHILSRTRSSKIKDIIKLLNISIDIIFPGEEAHYVSIIESSFDLFKTEKQYSIGSYIIDLYFPEYKLAIEIDENNHISRSKDKEIKREEYIKNQLNCSFIRFNPSIKYFNIGIIISQIFKHIKDQQKIVLDQQQSLLEEKDDRIKKLQRETQVIEGKNVVYLATSDDREKDGIFTVGKAIDLKNRLQVYNNNKLHNFKIVKFFSCKSVKLMDAIEQIILSKFNKYKIVSKRDVFQLPIGKDVSFFTKSFDYLSKYFEDIEEDIELEERSEEEKKDLIDEVKESKKEDKSEFNKKYREEHHDEILNREKSFRENNKEALKIRNKEYTKNNPEKEKIRKAKYASEHKEERKEYMQGYREEKANEIAEARKKYNLEHKEENEKRCECSCGSIVSRQNLTAHLDTDIHKRFVETGETLQEQRKEETLECECGLTISKRGLKRHQKSKLHLKFKTDGIKIKN